MKKSERIKKLQDALLKSHQELMSGEISSDEYSKRFKDVKKRITEIRQEKKISCENCSNLIISGYGRQQYTCKHKHKVRGVMNLFSINCKDKQEK